MVTRDEVLERLGQVMDPELGLNIVDLGLIYEIDIRGKKKGKRQSVAIRMTFTTPACPLMNEILEEIKGRLDSVPDTDFDVTVVFEPPWTPERMSERAKIKMGII